MIITRAPLRVSFFGGSADIEDYYQKHGCFIIGTTIDKYVYTSLRYRPEIVSDKSIISYSEQEVVISNRDIKHPLIKEILKYNGETRAVDLHTFADIPSRTGLGGSSSFCVSLLYALRQLQDEFITWDDLALDAIDIERNRLNEPGGIQDQIWAVHGGLNTIEIEHDGSFNVKPLPVTEKFKKRLEESIILIYTNGQRETNSIAKSHENKDKKQIHDIAVQAYEVFIQEDIPEIGYLLSESWNHKRLLSPLIATPRIEEIIDTCLDNGAYGAKLLGAGGQGFVMAICSQEVKKKLKEIYRDNIMDFKFEDKGVHNVFVQQ